MQASHIICYLHPSEFSVLTANKHLVMASPKFSFLIVLASLSIYAPCSSFEDHDINLQIAPSPPTLVKAEKVNLSLYYEALCPYSVQFIMNGLVKVFDGDLMNIVNLRLIPYGNAQIRQPGNQVLCQHGPDECYLNSIEACAIKSWPDVKKHFKFIQCVESQFNQSIAENQSKEDAWKACCQKLGMNVKPVQSCYDSGLEKKLILKYANETDNLVPPHEYVPWVVVNKQPLLDDYEKFVRYVCAAYEGSPKPEACRSVQPMIDSNVNANSIRQGCYKGEEHQEQLKLRNDCGHFSSAALLAGPAVVMK